MRRALSAGIAGLVLLVAGALAPGLVSNALSRPTIRQSFFGAYPTAVGSKLDNLPSHTGHCGVCHYDFNGGGPRNPFGVRLGDVIGNFANNDAGRQLAIHSIENEDPDGDTYTSLTEVTNLTYANTPTFPGLTPALVGNTSNVPNVSEISGYLVPTTGADVTPPTVTVTSPDGAESWTGGTAHAITWTATDNVGVVAVDLFYRDGDAADWSMITRNLGNTGSSTWFVHDTPTAQARVRVVARDAAGNGGEDMSDALFAILATPGVAPTTLRDFHQPGTQPFGGGAFETHDACATCHGGYDPAVEPAQNFRGSMMAQAGRDPLFFACMAVAEQDAPGAGDLCLRCHTSFGWLEGRSQPTSGAQLLDSDRDGVSCDLCHRMVDPIYKPGVSPPEDQSVLGALLPGHTPAAYSNGQYVSDPNVRKRGPFDDTVAPHAVLTSGFHQSGDFCGTCHDVSNPVFSRVSGADYAPGAFDQAAASMASDVLMPLERTYSEWKNSAFPAGVYAPEFAGNKPDGIVATCQDCHLHDVSGKGCNDPAAALRPNLPLHDMTGGSSWMAGVVASLYPTEVDAAALAAGAARAIAILQKAALLEVAVTPEGDSTRALITVTNRSGHKLPTGYPEGRRMWLHVVARNGDGAVVYESGAYDAATGVLSHDPEPVVYQAELGLSPPLAGALGLPSGPSFHFALNDTVYMDNRIPPLGFTNAAFAAFGGQPVDPAVSPGPRYPDGQNFDVSAFPLPPEARSVTARLLYQSTSKDYVEFLRDQNTTNATGQIMHDAWAANGRAAPVVMATGSAEAWPVAVEPPLAGAPTLRPASNPFRGALELRLEMGAPGAVWLEVYDARGRRVARRDLGTLGSGPQRLVWNGRDDSGHDAGSGVFWVKVRADRRELGAKVVRLR